MGGHGALTLHLKHPQRYRSVSAFSPIVAPSQVPWGQKAFTAYLGSDRAAWQRYDATELVKKQPSTAHILIDQGAADQFLERELQPQRFVDSGGVSGPAGDAADAGRVRPLVLLRVDVHRRSPALACAGVVGLKPDLQLSCRSGFSPTHLHARGTL